MKKPANWSELAGFVLSRGRGEKIRTSGLYVPNVALYLAKLHPDTLVPRAMRFQVRRSKS